MATLENTEELNPEMIEESVESKIQGHQAQIDQMTRMIAENERQIALGDDIEARKNMINHLKKSIENEKSEIANLKA